jgi:hypothetical protein
MMIFWLVLKLETSHRVIISWRILVSFLEDFLKIIFWLWWNKPLSFHNSSFALKILFFNVICKAKVVWHTPCFVFFWEGESIMNCSYKSISHNSSSLQLISYWVASLVNMCTFFALEIELYFFIVIIIDFYQYLGTFTLNGIKAKLLYYFLEMWWELDFLFFYYYFPKVT